jgi:hypothetical protein
MTAGEDSAVVSEYFRDLGLDLATESHVASIEQLAAAPFTVYVVEQKLGDLVLVPPRSYHQVVNSGGITMKMSWSRMTVDGLTSAFFHELPVYHRHVHTFRLTTNWLICLYRICRHETYRVKDTVYHTLLHLTEQLST